MNPPPSLPAFFYLSLLKVRFLWLAPPELPPIPTTTLWLLFLCCYSICFISNTITSSPLLFSSFYPWNWSPASVSIMLEKSMSVLADYWARFCFLAMKIILSDWKRDQAISKISSETSSKITTTCKELETKESKKRKVQKNTTMASNMFQKPPSIKRFTPSKRTLKQKSDKTQMFRRHSMNKKKGVWPILKP